MHTCQMSTLVDRVEEENLEEFSLGCERFGSFHIEKSAAGVSVP